MRAPDFLEKPIGERKNDTRIRNDEQKAVKGV
jgi:hypothetical protein